MVQTSLTQIQKMSPENFCFWLQGLFELQPDLKELTPAQVEMIRQHLKYVFEGKQVHAPMHQYPVPMPQYTPQVAPLFPQPPFIVTSEDGTLQPISTVC